MQQRVDAHDDVTRGVRECERHGHCDRPEQRGACERAAIFLTVNGAVLLTGERLRRRSEVRVLATVHGAHGGAGDPPGHRSLETLDYTPFAIYCLVDGAASVIRFA